MTIPFEVDQEFKPFEFAIGVIVNAHLGGVMGDHAAVVTELDEEGIMLARVLAHDAEKMGMPIVGEPMRLETPGQMPIFVAVIPIMVIERMLDRLRAAPALMALRKPCPAWQMRAVWKRGQRLAVLAFGPEQPPQQEILTTSPGGVA
jgi:hypothetical protein